VIGIMICKKTEQEHGCLGIHSEVAGLGLCIFRCNEKERKSKKKQAI
jgi:hypothetical protein